jgi:hypothetical protein
VARRRLDRTQGRRDDPDVRMLLSDAVDHLEERRRVETGAGTDLRSGDSQALLEVLLVPHEDVDVIDDPPENRLGALPAAERLPQSRPVVQVEGHDRTGGLRRPHGLDDQLPRWPGSRTRPAAASRAPGRRRPSRCSGP